MSYTWLLRKILKNKGLDLSSRPYYKKPTINEDIRYTGDSPIPDELNLTAECNFVEIQASNDGRYAWFNFYPDKYITIKSNSDEEIVRDVISVAKKLRIEVKGS